MDRHFHQNDRQKAMNMNNGNITEWKGEPINFMGLMKT